jgi:type 1 glutamine amidotransferase
MTASSRLIGAGLMTACLLTAMAAKAAADDAAKGPHVVFVTGDDEYRSEISMPMIARILERRHGFRCSIARAVDPATGKANPKFKTNIEGLDALKTADLAVIFVRFRALPDDQLKRILDYVDSGRPVVGLRTATHSFLYPSGDPRSRWNDGFGIEVFGQKWITHHGHSSRTDVSVIEEAKDHPILRGVPSSFECASWLYHVAPLVGDCRPLLEGKSIASEKKGKDLERYPPRQPVAWTKSHKGGRVFFTTLGHPKDFEQPAMRRLLVNGIIWALGREVPAGGASADPVEDYVAPPTH